MNLSNFYNQLVNASSGAERIFEIIDTKAEILDKPSAIDIGDIQGKVEFSHVDFSYDGEKKVLSDVSFSVKPGETIALVGPTGAGKSTIVNLISRFYDIQSGKILIDDKNIQDIRIGSLRSQMGIMTQDNYIFSGTIRENIAYGNSEATEEEIIAAAKSVHAHDFIMDLEYGYDTILTARGGELSNGQRQLLAFARTMLTMPKILILDEATSALDNISEYHVQKAIASSIKGRTTFIVAHRLSTIRDADRIVVMEQGNMVECGTFEELMAKKGKFYELKALNEINLKKAEEGLA